MEKLGLTKEGIILVNKPPGVTSHDIVDFVRKRFGIKAVGHAGTLDPLAEGLLIILVGTYTKLFSRFVDFDKEYEGVLKLGEITRSGDSQGEVIESRSYSGVNKDKIIDGFNSFLGEIEQVPPMLSAIRVKGRRLYKLARRGLMVERKPRKVKIYQLTVNKIDLPFVEFYVKCSKGTYIRKLAEDVGEKLGCGAHIVKIKRLAIGPFSLLEAVNLEDIDESALRKI
ncbi:MAG: tRNA pseudouridine(55) synthase TruB [Candidatus Omnitrophica bacterium]|nr:tRNA pseudouridine(55) synthase TruB [Candidatus Omnitrophota bacterium]